MTVKNFGVSLMEIVIVIGIFAIVSAGVTNLSLKVIESQRDEETITNHNHIYNSIQDDMRNDLNSAAAVWLTAGGPSDNTTNNYLVLQNPCAAAPAAIGPFDTLNILVQTGYTPGSPGTTTYDLIVYRFMQVDTINSLTRFRNNVSINDDPGNIWPKDIEPANFTDPLSGNMPASVNTTALMDASPNRKLYNHNGHSRENNTITGSFEATYGIAYNAANTHPWLGVASGACTYYLNNVNINGLQIQAQGYKSKYDNLFGKSNLVGPTLSFQINPSIKFF